MLISGFGGTWCGLLADIGLGNIAPISTAGQVADGGLDSRTALETSYAAFVSMLESWFAAARFVSYVD